MAHDDERRALVRWRGRLAGCAAGRTRRGRSARPRSGTSIVLAAWRARSPRPGVDLASLQPLRPRPDGHVEQDDGARAASAGQRRTAPISRDVAGGRRSTSCRAGPRDARRSPDRARGARRRLPSEAIATIVPSARCRTRRMPKTHCGPAELGVHRRRATVSDRTAPPAVQVPPAGPVRDEHERAVGRPRRLDDRLVGPAGDAWARRRACRPAARRPPTARCRPTACSAGPRSGRRCVSRSGSSRGSE